jgi:hypothetical protein
MFGYGLFVAARTVNSTSVPVLSKALNEEAKSFRLLRSNQLLFGFKIALSPTPRG